jgi:hypothetical protein
VLPAWSTSFTQMLCGPVEPGVIDALAKPFVTSAPVPVPLPLPLPASSQYTLPAVRRARSVTTRDRPLAS